ncbi:MAG: helix-turn-helix domain-containing protein [Bacteroides sp.]|nr:helix-turn-helix domain-containing protein [Bacteroides sp.]
MLSNNTKQDREAAKACAHRLYLNGITQKMIAKTVGVTEATVSGWVKSGGWKQERDDQSTSTIALANSMMAAAKQMADLIITEISAGNKDIKTITQCSDNLVKIMAAAERIANTVTKATIIDVIIGLERWLMHRAETDKELTPELIQLFNKYHKEYIKYISSKEG